MELPMLFMSFRLFAPFMSFLSFIVMLLYRSALSFPSRGAARKNALRVENSSVSNISLITPSISKKN